MTPQERELINELFERLAQLENQPRDPSAERAIQDGLDRAPHSIYFLVQTVLVQDEALKAANAKLEAMESGGEPERPRSFLEGMRAAVSGRQRQGSVPSVGPATAGGGGFGPGAHEPPMAGGPMPSEPMPGGPMPGGPMPGGPMGGGSFLGSAAATAAGMVGGSLLLNGIRSLFGGGHHGAFAAGAMDSSRGAQAGSPWGGSSEMARKAGFDDIGRAPPHQNEGGAPQGFHDPDAQHAAEHQDENSADEDEYSDDMDDDDYDGDDYDEDFDDGGDIEEA
jgi:uncharacterized protein